MHIRHRLTTGLALYVLGTSTALAQPPSPVVIDLETLGNTYSEAYAVNSRGQVVGRSGGQAFVWTLQTGMIRLGPLDPWGSSANIVNDRGEVAGTSRLRGFYWSKTTGVVDIGTLGGGGATPADMNNLGQMVGESLFDPDSWTPRAFFWTLETGMVDLGTLPGGHMSGAYRINDAGQVLGWSETGAGKVLPVMWTRETGLHRFLPPLPLPPTIADFNERGDVAGMVGGHGFHWSAGDGLVDIGTLGGPYSWASAINDHGQVAGISLAADPTPPHAFIWTPGRGMTDLGRLGRYTYVRDLSNGGEIVGFSAAPSYPALAEVAYIATADYGILPLPPIAGRQSSATAINDRGQLVGFSTVGDGSVEQHAVLWLVRTPLEQLDAAVADLGELVADGRLPTESGQVLRSVLAAARAQHLAGWTTNACQRLRLYNRLVGSLQFNRVLAESEADVLRDQTDWTRFSLGCQ